MALPPPPPPGAIRLNAPRVAVIVVNWNGWADTVECLESIQAVRTPECRTVVVDNGSTDDSVARIASWARARGLDFAEGSKGTTEAKPFTLLRNDRNEGFGAACNRAARVALDDGAEFLFFLNNDASLHEPHALGQLVRALEDDPGAGIVGPAVVMHHDPGRLWSLGGRVGLRSGVVHHVGIGEELNGQRGVARADYVSGCAMLVRADLFRRIGGFDEAFFLYFEETDWTMRARADGWHVLVQRDARVRHRGARSTRRAGLDDHANYHFLRSRLRFAKRWSGPWFWFPVLPRILAKPVVRSIVAAARGNPRLLREVAAAVTDFMLDRPAVHRRPELARR